MNSFIVVMNYLKKGCVRYNVRFAKKQIVKGNKIDNAVIEKCAQAASEESSPITDVRASAAYRKEMVKVLVRQAIIEAVKKRL